MKLSFEVRCLSGDGRCFFLFQSHSIAAVRAKNNNNNNKKDNIITRIRRVASGAGAKCDEI